MDSEVFKQLMDFMIHHIYPDGLNRTQRFIIKRRAETFRIIDGELHHICRRKTFFAERLAKVVEDIRKWVLQCPQSQSKRAFIKEVEYTPIEVTEPLELVGMDLVDQGGEFCNKVNYNLCERLGIKRSLCSPYTHRQMGWSLNKLVEGQPKREARCPSEVPEKYEITEEKVSSLVQMEEVFEGLKKQEAVFAEVKSNIAKSQDKIRKRKEGGPFSSGGFGFKTQQKVGTEERRKVRGRHVETIGS
ncbi:hypothetical protein KUCAC02_016535 [Chaenocephalus aceratus]|nr:hypothetical protein KUCAC02_016535 [Chaenocephalus aceratus]